MLEMQTESQTTEKEMMNTALIHLTIPYAVRQAHDY
jgi:hypothetical protein